MARVLTWLIVLACTAAPVQPAPDQEAPTPLPRRENVRQGDKVAFEDKYLNTVVGTNRADQPTHDHIGCDKE